MMEATTTRHHDSSMHRIPNQIQPRQTLARGSFEASFHGLEERLASRCAELFTSMKRNPSTENCEIQNECREKNTLAADAAAEKKRIDDGWQARFGRF